MELGTRLKIWNLSAVAMSTVVGVGVWLLFGKNMPPQIPLLYSRPWGEAQLAAPWQILLLPALAVGIGLFLSWFTDRIQKETVLTAMALATSLVIQIILILGMLRISLLVI